MQSKDSENQERTQAPNQTQGVWLDPVPPRAKGLLWIRIKYLHKNQPSAVQSKRKKPIELKDTESFMAQDVCRSSLGS